MSKTISPFLKALAEWQAARAAITMADAIEMKGAKADAKISARLNAETEATWRLIRCPISQGPELLERARFAEQLAIDAMHAGHFADNRETVALSVLVIELAQANLAGVEVDRS